MCLKENLFENEAMQGMSFKRQKSQLFTNKTLDIKKSKMGPPNVIRPGLSQSKIVGPSFALKTDQTKVQNRV